MDIAKSLVWVGVLLVCASTVSARDLRIATGEYAPFTGETLESYGTVNHRVQDIVARADHTATYTFMPWKRALEATRRGNFDATSFWYFSEERNDDFIHVGPVIADRLVFFRQSETEMPNWDELADLSELTIGIVPGYTYTSEFWALVEAGVLTVSEAPSDLANFKKMQAGRIDLVPMSEEAGWHLLRQNFPEDVVSQVVVDDRPLSVTNGFLLVSRMIEGAEGIAADLQAIIDATPVDLAESTR